MSADRYCLHCGDAIPTQDTPCACHPHGDDAPRGRHSTLTALLSVLGDLAGDDGVLRDVYGIDLDHGDAPLEVALRAWVDAGMPGRSA